jgi:hypothetical protein
MISAAGGWSSPHKQAHFAQHLDLSGGGRELKSLQRRVSPSGGDSTLNVLASVGGDCNAHMRRRRSRRTQRRPVKTQRHRSLHKVPELAARHATPDGECTPVPPVGELESGGWAGDASGTSWSTCQISRLELDSPTDVNVEFSAGEVNA